MNTKEEIILSLIDLIKKENDGTHLDFAIPGYAQKKFAGYHSMRAELSFCEHAIEKFLSEKLDNVTAICVWHTVISLYSKCFTDATKSKFPKLEPDKVFNDSDKEMRETHEKLMDLRNTLVAHRGDTINEINLVYLRLDLNESARHVKVKWVKRLRPTDEDLKLYLKNVKHLIKVIDKLIFKAADKVWDYMLKNHTPQELALMKIAGPTNR